MQSLQELLQFSGSNLLSIEPLAGFDEGHLKHD